MSTHKHSKITHQLTHTIAFLMLLAPTLLHAQLLNKIKSAVGNKAKNVLSSSGNSGNTTPTGSGSTTGRAASMPYEEAVSTFEPGTVLLFADDMATDIPGHMAKRWKSNAGGTISQLPDVAGKWLALKSNATYRLDTLLNLPSKFSFEFDILTRTEEARDIKTVSFGFSSNNSARTYLYPFDKLVSGYVEWRSESDKINIVNNETKSEASIDFPTGQFANALLHISLNVDGSSFRLYVNKSKVYDTNDFFNPATPKNFFFSTYDTPFLNDAKLYIGNVKVYGFQ